MPVVTFSENVAFPIAAVRMLLSQHLPDYRWQCGEDDVGAEKQMGAFQPLILITGRSASTVVFTELRTIPDRLDGPAPPHQWHLSIGEPTTELGPVIDRIKLSICAAVMFMDEAGARCQLRPGGNWLGVDELYEVFKRVFKGEAIAIADHFGLPPTRFDGSGAADRPMPPAVAPADAPSVQPGPDIATRMLSPLVLLLERNLSTNWGQVEEFARELDPEGGWSHVSSGGSTLLSGRGTRIFIDEKPEAVPDYVFEEAFARSFWFSGDRGAATRHSRHITIGTALDTSACDWTTTRQVAKVVTLVAGILARLPGTAAALNLGVGTIFEPAMAGNFLTMLGRDQLPVMLWTYTHAHCLDDGDISLATTGLVPFLGHEIEVWNAPLSRDAVQDKVSNLILYLLDQGPVIGHGDSAGSVEGDRSIRCFLGPSRAGRDARALFLEFETAKIAQPKPDLPDSAAPAPRPGDDAAGLAAGMIDEALRSVMERSSPGLRKILGDIRQERSGGPSATPPPTTTPSAEPPATPPQPGVTRRVGGFGRKGL
jgi:hypothetical protein